MPQHMRGRMVEAVGSLSQRLSLCLTAFARGRYPQLFCSLDAQRLYALVDEPRVDSWLHRVTNLRNNDTD
jgi:hypothetical protein